MLAWHCGMGYLSAARQESTLRGCRWKFLRTKPPRSTNTDVAAIAVPVGGEIASSLGTRHSAVLEIALPSVAKRQPDPEGHESNGRDHQHEDTLADSLLAVLGGCRGGTATHGTTLAKRGSSPQKER